MTSLTHVDWPIAIRDDVSTSDQCVFAAAHVLSPKKNVQRVKTKVGVKVLIIRESVMWRQVGTVGDHRAYNSRPLSFQVSDLTTTS